METIGIQYRIEGGIVKLDSLEMSRLAQFCKDHPGVRGIMFLSIIGADKSQNQAVYFKRVVVPCWQALFASTGEYFSLELTEETLISLFAFKQFGYSSFSEMDRETAMRYIQQLIKSAAEQGCIIPPPHG